MICTFRGETDIFAGITWRDEPVNCLGVYVGNDRTECARIGFGEVIEKTKSKMSYWSGKYISLKGRVKVLNIFVLSKLWYILESQDIPPNMLKDCNRLIADFVWNDLHQTRLENLHEKYENGGLQLQDIDLKMKTLRIKWLRELIACDESHI